MLRPADLGTPVKEYLEGERALHGMVTAKWLHGKGWKDPSHYSRFGSWESHQDCLHLRNICQRWVSSCTVKDLDAEGVPRKGLLDENQVTSSWSWHNTSSMSRNGNRSHLEGRVSSGALDSQVWQLKRLLGSLGAGGLLSSLGSLFYLFPCDHLFSMW